ncbi:MAG: signal peptidase II [Candidatus Binataceae bacterium]
MLDGTVRLERTENPGGFLSVGDTLPSWARGILFTAGGGLLIIVTMTWASRSQRITPMQTVGAALICGGGIGNLIDRVVHDGRVTDFLNVGIGGLRTGIFNVADMALMLGIGLVIICGARVRPPHGNV